MSGWSGLTPATGISLLLLVSPLLMWSELTWARKAMGKLHLWWVLKLQANQVNLLSCSRKVLKLSHNMPHQPLKQKPRSCKTTKNCPSKNIIVCKNRFEPLMEEGLFLDDFDTLECEIQAVGTAPGDTGQNVSSYHNENWQHCDKFDKALLKKRVALVSSCRLKIVLIMWLAKIKVGESFGVIPLSTLRKYEGPETKNQPISDPLQLHKSVKQFGCPNFLGARIPVVSNLNIDNWKFHLRDYWDTQLLDLLEFGFPLDFDTKY